MLEFHYIHLNNFIITIWAQAYKHTTILVNFFNWLRDTQRALGLLSSVSPAVTSNSTPTRSHRNAGIFSGTDKLNFPFVLRGQTRFFIFLSFDSLTTMSIHVTSNEPTRDQLVSRLSNDDISSKSSRLLADLYWNEYNRLNISFIGDIVDHLLWHYAQASKCRMENQMSVQ